MVDDRRDLISRIDERTKALQDGLIDFRDSVEKKFDVIERYYVQKADFHPVRKLVYGFVGFLLLSIGGMFIALIVRSNNLPMEVTSHPSNHSTIRSLLPMAPTDKQDDQ